MEDEAMQRVLQQLPEDKSTDDEGARCQQGGLPKEEGSRKQACCDWRPYARDDPPGATQSHQACCEMLVVPQLCCQCILRLM